MNEVMNTNCCKCLNFRLSVAGCCLLLLLCAACGSEDGFRRAKGHLQSPLVVNTLYTMSGNAATRAAVAQDLPAGVEIGFYMKNSVQYSGINNVVSVYDAASKWWMPKGDTIWLYAVPADVAVYYPYKASQGTSNTFKLSASLRTGDSKDIWSTRFQANAGIGRQVRTLHQIYSRLTVTFVKDVDAEYTGPGKLSNLSLACKNLYKTGTFNLQDSIYGDYGGGTGFTPGTNLTVTGFNPAASDAARVDLLLVPYYGLEEDITITATVDTKEMKVVVPRTKLRSFDPGKQYKVTVKLKPSALVVGSVKTTDWEPQTAFDSDANLDLEDKI